MALPRLRTAFEMQFLLAVNDQKRIARGGVERFHPAADEDRNSSERCEINLALCSPLGGSQLGHRAGSNRENNPGQKTFHVIAFRRCRENPTR
jgi:hypothetical protein